MASSCTGKKNNPETPFPRLSKVPAPGNPRMKKRRRPGERRRQEHANLLSCYLDGLFPYTRVRLPSQETASIRVEPSG